MRCYAQNTVSCTRKIERTNGNGHIWISLFQNHMIPLFYWIELVTMAITGGKCTFSVATLLHVASLNCSLFPVKRHQCWPQVILLLGCDRTETTETQSDLRRPPQQWKKTKLHKSCNIIWCCKNSTNSKITLAYNCPIWTISSTLIIVCDVLQGLPTPQL